MARTIGRASHPGSFLRGRNLVSSRIPTVAYVLYRCFATAFVNDDTVISRERPDEALRIIQRLHRDKADPDNVFAYREYQQIKQQYQIDKKNEVSWKDMFVKASYRKRVIIGVIVMFASQTTGTTVIASTSPSWSLIYAAQLT
jgi:hypothetical protein